MKWSVASIRIVCLAARLCRLKQTFIFSKEHIKLFPDQWFFCEENEKRNRSQSEWKYCQSNLMEMKANKISDRMMMVSFDVFAATACTKLK